jgi:hypothetical protein
MLSAGIVDPAKVVCIALQGATSIAALIITTEDGRGGSEEEGGSTYARRRNGRYGLLIIKRNMSGAAEVRPEPAH